MCGPFSLQKVGKDGSLLARKGAAEFGYHRKAHTSQANTFRIHMLFNDVISTPEFV
jgi:hypothetical protein